MAADLPERLFAGLDRQLAAKGLFVKAGTLLDASLIEADVKRPPMDQGEVSERDPDAGFTRRGQRSFFGYKAHLAVDQGTDLIRGAILTGAALGDSLARRQGERFWPDITEWTGLRPCRRNAAQKGRNQREALRS